MRLRLLLVWLMASAAPVFAVEGDPAITRLRVGFADRYKVGCWTPVEVTLRGGNELLDGQLELVVPDGDGVPTRVISPPTMPVAILPSRDTTVAMFAKIGARNPEISIRFHVGRDEKLRRTFRPGDDGLADAFDSNRRLIVSMGHPLGVATSTTEDAHEQSTIHATITEASQFPAAWFGYDAVDTVILCTSDPTVNRQLSAAGAQLAALDRWVRLGGQLVLCVGSNAQEVLAPDAPLAKFAPGKFAELVSLKRTSAWETYAGTTERLDAQSLVDAQGEARLEAPRLEDVQGRIVAFEGSQAADLPLVIRTPHGLGEIVFVAADLDRAPFTRWKARGQMLEKLLGQPKPKAAATEPNAASASTTLGYTDMAGQLRSALEQFAGVRLAPFSLVACLILLYILAIGPLDYLLLKRWLKHMEWTWFTFPAIVLAFSAAAYLLAPWLKGDQLLTNQVDVIDYDAETQLVRGSTWSNVFSPRVDSYDITYKLSLPGKGDFQSNEPLVSWMGLPGDGFGGMSSKSGSVALFTESYSFSPTLDALRGMPIAVWSTKGIAGRWSGIAASPIVAELVDQGDSMLAGSLQSRLDEPLRDCVLLYDRWAYPIGTLDARARFSVEKKLEPQAVETYFKRQSLIDEQGALSTYDPTSLDVGRIVETMMFHQHLGGADYTQLSNQYQHFIDLSGLLRCGRAILVGRGPKAGGQLMRGITDLTPLENAGDRHWTFYRFVFPVGTKDGSFRQRVTPN